MRIRGWPLRASIWLASQIDRTGFEIKAKLPESSSGQAIYFSVTIGTGNINS